MSDSPPVTRGSGLRDDQHRAVMVQGVSVALSASAGCGKTTVLTERYLTELDQAGGRALERVVALSFTKKAARELRGRIRARLLARLESEGDRERSMVLIRGLDAAPISTFHQYCKRLVRRYALELGIDPEFDVFDADVASSIREEAAEHTLRERLDQENEDVIELALRHRLATVREAIVTLIESPAELEEWGRLEPDQVVERWMLARDQKLLPRVVGRLMDDFNEIRETLEEVDSSNDKVNTLRAEVIAAIDDLGATKPRDRSTIERVKALRELLKVKSVGKRHWPSEEDYDRIKDLFQERRKAIDDQLRPWSTDDRENDLAAAREGLAFSRLAIDAQAAYRRLKERRGGLDFEDLLTRTLELLRDGIRGGSGSRRLLDVVLVDEFQDTDHVQSEVLRHLGGKGFLSGRVFVVGDVKQSIYRFRGAEPAIFGDWRARFPEAGRLSLTESFRSAPGVTRFVNLLFRGCFSELDLATSGDPGAYDLRPIRSKDPGEPAVEFVWGRAGSLEGEGDPSAGGEEPVDAARRRVAEASVLARRIRERLEAGWTVAEKGTGNPRAARPGDIAYLFRAMTDIRPYETALVREGLDYYTVGGSAFYAQQEILDMVNLIVYLEDPFDEVALAGALRGPFFGLSDDALHRLATMGGGLVEGFARHAHAADLPPDDRRAAARAARLVERWRGLKDHMPMARLLETILDESGYEGALVCDFLGVRKLANARKLVCMARSFDRQGGFTLGALATRLRGLLNRRSREEQAPLTEEDDTCVRLMSIHQAKGLEFPIVVVPDLARARSHIQEAVFFDRLLGVLVARGGDDSESRPGLGRVVHGAIDRVEEDEESLRLFYVAATRARDALILSAGVGGDRPSQAPAWCLLESRFDVETGESYPVDGLDPVSVSVHQAAVPTDVEETIRGGKRVPLDEIERAIVLADQASGPPVRNVRPWPSFVDLDLAGELAVGERGIDRVMRAIVISEGWSRGESRVSIVARAGVSIVPAASGKMIKLADDRLGPWLESPLLRALKGAIPGSLQVGFELVGSLPTPGGRSVALHGRCDLLFTGRDGITRTLIVVSSEASPDRACLLRRLLSKTAPEWAKGAMSEAWLLEHGPRGRLAVVEPPSDDPDEFARELDGLLSRSP